MDTKKQSIVYMILITVIWSPSFEITRQLLFNLGPMTVVFFRFLIGIIPVCIIRKYFKIDEKIRKCDYKWMILASILCILHYILSNVSNINLNASELIAFSSFQAIINMIFSSIILNIVITPNMSFSVGVASIGAVLTINMNTIYSNSFVEYLYMVLAMVFWVLYCIIVKKLLIKYKVTTIILYQAALSVIILLPSLFYENNQFRNLTFNNMIQMFILGFFGIGLCFMMNAYSLKNIGTVAVSIFMNFGPIFVTLINIFIFNQSLGSISMIGIFMICIGTITTLRDVLNS